MNETQSQEAKAQEHKMIDIAEFRPITKEATLREYELKNRDRILSASRKVRDAFDAKWKKITGRHYWLPVTATQTIGSKPTERIDPESNGYKGYWEVMFSPKGRPDDPEDVTLSVNGQCLQMKRSSAVILPGPFLECADHGLYPVYKQLPGMDRKIVGMVKHFPYTVLRRASESEYIEQKKIGDRATREARQAEERATK